MKKLTNISRVVVSVLAVFLSGVVLYAYVYYIMVTGSAFVEFKSWCADSKGLAELIGEFRDVNLLPYGSFYEKDKGSTGFAGFSARAVGTTGAVNLKVEMSRSGYKWEVGSVLVNGRSLSR